MSVTVSFQPTGPVPGNSGPVTMRGPSLTIGRGPANDLVLPDPDRMLSKSHCVIEDQGGNVVVIDLSTNGTFLNYSKVALGPVPTPLSNGDVLTLGLFELVVNITSEMPSALDLAPDPIGDLPITPGHTPLGHDPLADLLDGPGSGGDVLDELLGNQSVPTGPSQITPVDPIDELLPPGGEDDDDPFFLKPLDGREGEGASFSAHNAAHRDVFEPPRPPYTYHEAPGGVAVLGGQASGLACYDGFQDFNAGFGNFYLWDGGQSAPSSVGISGVLRG